MPTAMPTAMLTRQDRLIEAVRRARGCPSGDDFRLKFVPMAEPVVMSDMVAPLLPGRFVITSTLEHRLFAAENCDARQWTFADLSGDPLGGREWPSWTHGRLTIHDPDGWLSDVDISVEGIHRLMRPKVLLVALYHREYFPLPRFPLAISDVARAGRATLLGQFRLMDMQLGVTMDDIKHTVRVWKPDILGISATFGQHDLMTQLLDFATTLHNPEPLIIAGGSLTARNEKALIRRYPELLVARGAGEDTMQDVLAFWHGDLDLKQVRGIGYRTAATGAGMSIRLRHTGAVPNRLRTDIFPELDLLDLTFRHKGVAQLETSRGCTSYCSFCPRGHKGQWAGTVPQHLPWVLAEMREVFDRHPHVSKTLYLVDEEFIGRGDDAVARALAVAETVHGAGFRWETSCRVDQVAWPGKDDAWHAERVNLWRGLLDRGLRRCLFGVESGVTSILQRFHKETTAEQNARAIRTLSALGVPTRFTYITFDHLMSFAELVESYTFQARTDLILNPLPYLTAQEIVAGVQDPAFIAAHSSRQPFYKSVSYMLVSMECLIGSAYTKAVEAQGLAGAQRPSMGRVDASFADWRIGVASEHAQLWVDRNFALDYTFKSLEKVLDGPPRHAVRDARVVLKDAAFTVLGDMLRLIDLREIGRPQPEAMRADLRAMMGTRFEELQNHMAATVAQVTPVLSDVDADLLHREYERWAASDSWQLINAADPCGT